MRVDKKGSILSVKLTSGVGYDCIFEHNCGTEANAAAWQVHLQREQNAEDDRKNNYQQNLWNLIQKERRRVYALRGVITKLKDKKPCL